jgi:polysaccharide export outer membrane protein
MLFTAVLVALLPLVTGGLTAAGPGAPEYRIGPRDVLRVTVWGHDDLTRTVTIAADGTFQFPLVGDVRGGGLTASEVENRLRERLARDYLVDPQVAVSVQEYRSQRVFVLGEADRPGTYPLTGQTSLLDVLSQAGGPGKGAGRQVVVIRFPRSEGPVAPGAAGSTMFRANLKKLLDGDASENLTLENGDTIFVPKLTSFFVLGEVQRQGAYTMERETSALEAVTVAGGFTDRAAARAARVLRKRADGSQETIDLDLGHASAGQFLLVEGDTLVVPRGNSFFVSGEVRRPGAYQLERSTTAFGAVTVAGGFTDKAAQGQVKLTRRTPSGEQRTLVLDLSGDDATARDLVLHDGDMLLVPSGNTFYVLGEVRKPGPYQLEAGTSVTAAITMAGGLTDRGAPSQVKLTRRKPSGDEQVIPLDLSVPRSGEFLLRDGDVLHVAAGNTFYVLGEVRKPGAYQLDQLTTTIQAIAVAGGFTEKAAPNRTKVIRTHADGRQETLIIDLNDVLKRGRKDRDVPLTANDVIVVPESFF